MKGQGLHDQRSVLTRLRPFLKLPKPISRSLSGAQTLIRQSPLQLPVDGQKPCPQNQVALAKP